MGKEEEGYIYILTNPSFPSWIKIGYAKDVDQRVDELNSSTAVPFSFVKHAYLKVNMRNADQLVHKMIDLIDSSLRSVEKVDGKITRKREFYNMEPDKAVAFLEMLASFANTGEKVIVVPRSHQEIMEDEDAKEDSLAKTPEEFVANQKPAFKDLYNKVVNGVKDKVQGFRLYTTNDYVGFKNGIGRTIAEFHFFSKSVRVHTIAPAYECPIGEKVPDSFLWTLNYKVNFDKDDAIPTVVELILESNRITMQKKDQKRKESFSFARFNIPVGSVVEFIRDNSIKPVVVDDRHIKWNGEVTSLSKLAENLVGYVCAGTQFFTFNGKLLADYLKDEE